MLLGKGEACDPFLLASWEERRRDGVGKCDGGALSQDMDPYVGLPPSAQPGF